MYRTLILNCQSIIKKQSVHGLISKIIKNHGPISVHTFMREVLTDFTEGYYMKKDVFGIHGDFTTSPEISQMFGELWGVWIVNEWINQGKPSTLQLVEFGPGRGSLMQDILRTLTNFPEILTSIQSINFVEVSPTLRKIQESNISKTLNHLNLDVSLNWWDNITELPINIPSVFLAHEFLDALPIHKFKKSVKGILSEVLVDIDWQNNNEDFRFVLSNRETPALTAFKNVLNYPNQTDYEISPEAAGFMVEVGKRLSRDGGFALLCDYGHNGENGDTFRAFKNHVVTDPLKDVGDSDLTADVNFRFLMDQLEFQIPSQIKVFGPICQKEFLTNMGIDVRLRVLLSNSKSVDMSNNLISSYKILTGDEEMGQRFKFMALLPNNPKYPSDYLPAGLLPLR